MDRPAWPGIVLATLVFALILLAAALVNRQPILYPDSEGYFRAGDAAVTRIASHFRLAAPAARDAGTPGRALERQERDGISTARSVYYGVPLALGGIWLPVICQAFLVAACIVLAAYRALSSWRILTVAAVALVSGLGVFASAVMPDVFAGLLVLSTAMLVSHGRELPRWETAFWLVVILAACLVHKSLVLILLLMLVSGALLWQEKALTYIAVVACIGAGGHFAVDLTVKQVTGSPPIGTPFLLARMIADGPAEKYLRDSCPTRHFTTCKYLNRFPVTENEFLWSKDPRRSVMGTADRETRTAIAAESTEIVLGTLSNYPLEQIGASSSNFARQVLTVGVREYGFVPNRLPLDLISTVMFVAYVIAMAGSGWLLATGGSQRFPEILLFGIFANAAVCGAISGVFDRYQGRVAWLALFAFAALLAQRKRTA